MKNRILTTLGALIIVVLSFIACPTTSSAQVFQEYDTNSNSLYPSSSELQVILDAYSYDAGLDAPLSDATAAAGDGVDAYVVEVFHFYNEMAISQSQETGELVAPQAALGDRWYWCGAGNTNNGPPANSADRVCRHHDWCLASAAGNRQAMINCDNAFINGMNAVKSQYAGSDRAYIDAAILIIGAARACRPLC